jgi:MoaA/NifB/PqqE/SkfB family radical SAM enzyme
MDAALFEGIIDGLVEEDCRFDHVILQWLGDPSLHPDLPRLIGIAAKGLAGRANYLRVDTNAITLTPARMDAIVDAWWPHRALPLLMVFTLDASSPETYTLVKGQDALMRVRKHIRHLIMRRAALPDDDVSLNVQLQFVVQPENAHEAGDFLSYWRAFLVCHGRGKGHDEILFKRLSVGAGGAGQAASDRLYDRTLRRFGITPGHGEDAGNPGPEVVVWRDRPWQHDDEQRSAPRQPCPGLWMTPVIRHDGALVMCCVDLQSELVLGNLGKTSFRTLWEGPLAVSRRLAHVEGRFSDVGPCGDCGGINWYGMPADTVKQWLSQVGERDAYETYAARMNGG